MLFVAAAMILLLRWRNVLLLATVALLLLALHAAARTPSRRLLATGRALLPTVLLAGTLRMLFYPSGAPLLEFWIVRVTTGGLAQGAGLALRLLSLALAVFLWIYTTPRPDLLRGLVKMGVPYAWGLTLALALRTIPALRATFGQVLEAQQARGLEFESLRGFARVRAMMPIFVATTIGAVRSADTLARALEARATGAPGVTRTYLRDLRLRPLDMLMLAAIVAGFAALLALTLTRGFGLDPLLVFGQMTTRSR